jgi:hypothetical protein
VVSAVSGESGFRIDFWEKCGGYLRTYDGDGHESVLLADWTSLHLDLVARDRGLKQLASSFHDQLLTGSLHPAVPRNSGPAESPVVQLEVQWCDGYRKVFQLRRFSSRAAGVPERHAPCFTRGAKAMLVYDPDQSWAKVQ